MMEYDRAIFLVYYLESVYGKPWVENGELQYTAQEIQAGMDFMTKLEEAHVIPTIATLQGDMACLLYTSPCRERLQYRRRPWRSRLRESGCVRWQQ